MARQKRKTITETTEQRMRMELNEIYTQFAHRN